MTQHSGDLYPIYLKWCSAAWWLSMNAQRVTMTQQHGDSAAQPIMHAQAALIRTLLIVTKLISINAVSARVWPLVLAFSRCACRRERLCCAAGRLCRRVAPLVLTLLIVTSSVQVSQL